MLVDTSGLLCYFDKDDIRHTSAEAHFHEAPFLFTHSYVLAELIPLCLSRGVGLRQALEASSSVIENPGVDVVWVDESLHRRALGLLAERPDKTYSVCDAVSFLLMRDRAVTDALTTDRHFEQEGFVRLLSV